MVKLPTKSMKKKLLSMWIFKVQMNLIIIRIIERIEILLKNNTIINTQFNGKTSYKINEKETTFHVDLQSTNESNNNTDNTSDSIKH